LIGIKFKSRLKKVFFGLLAGLVLFCTTLVVVYQLSSANSKMRKRIMGLYTRVVVNIAYRKYTLSLYNVLVMDLSRHPSTLPEYRIRMKRRDFEKLNSNLPSSGRNRSYRGSLTYAGETMPVRLRYRGDTMWHWFSVKRSWRIRTLRGTTLNGERRINLITPHRKHYFNDYIAFRMAKATGLPAPKSEFVVGYFNKKYMGIYHKVEQQDRYYQLRNKLAEGTMYELELGSPQQAMTAWQSSEHWQIAQLSGKEKAPKKILDKLFLELGKQVIDIATLKKVFDFSSYTKWKAVTLLFKSAHMDRGHNHRLYHDPINGKLRYLPWDIGEIESQLDPFYITTPFDRRFLSSPEILYQLQQAIYQIIITDYPARMLKKDLTSAYNLLKPYIQRQLNKEYSLIAYSDGDFKNKYLDILATLQARYKEYKKIYNQVHLASDGKGAYRFSSTVPIRIITEKGVSSLVYPIYSMEPIKNDVQWAWRFENVEIKFSPTSFFDASKNLRFYNAVTGIQIIPTLGDIGVAESEPVVPTQLNLSKTIHWQGNVTLMENIIVAKDTILNIYPGTQVRLGPGVSILVYGRVSAEGEKSKPITIGRLIKNKTWGVFALQGGNDGGSRFRYVNFDGGRDASIEGVFYSGAVSAYDSKTSFINCVFENSSGDDALNIKRGQSTIKESVFMFNKFDAVDLDFTEGVVESNIFYRNGNDAIDCGTASPLIKNNLVIASGDKGISIGERSHPVVSGNAIINNPMGVAIKDSSSPDVVENFFDNNRVAIHGYRKKVMFSGVHVITKRNCFQNNEKKNEVDVFSTVSIINKCRNNEEIDWRKRAQTILERFSESKFLSMRDLDNAR